MTLEDFQRLPLPAGTVNVQPPDGITLINVETNVYTQPRPFATTIDLVGFPVQVRAQPSRYSWDMGDGGAVGPTQDPGAAYPDLRTTHIYRSAGAYAITLTTYYTGEYSVAGGPWLPVDGEAQVASEAVAIEAFEARSRLYANP